MSKGAVTHNISENYMPFLPGHDFQSLNQLDYLVLEIYFCLGDKN